MVSLDTKKAMYYIDVLATIFKANADLSSIFVSIFNKSASFCKFMAVLKLTDVTPVHKKSRLEISNYLSVSFWKIDKFQNALKLFYQNFIVVSEKETTLYSTLLWLSSTWPYGCETSRIWFLDRIIETNK